MKKVIALILSSVLLFCGCSKATTVESQSSSSVSSSSTTETSDSSVSESPSETTEADNGYRDLSDPDLLDYIEDTTYEELVNKIDNDKYVVQNVEAIYISEEYLEELEYNSKQNIFFGYTLDEVDAQFKGERYVFTLGDEGETVVKPFESYDETTEKIISCNRRSRCTCSLCYFCLRCQRCCNRFYLRRCNWRIVCRNTYRNSDTR